VLARRIAVTGFSDGGFFALRLACQRAERLDAVAIVAATMVYRPCRPKARLRVTAVWNENDRRVPIRGRVVWFTLPGADAVSRFWRRANGCRLVARRETPSLRTERASRCRGRGGYLEYVVRDRGHEWLVPATAGEGVNTSELVAASLGL
jgi:poly(3-hydroxybutyrate) depolymerase